MNEVLRMFTMDTATWLDITVRILVSVALGSLIGFERQWRARTAGIRTNALVSLGSALFVILGAFAFMGGDPAAASHDPTRVAAQVVSGIGFLGAGVIMKHGGSITGINTAATLWASAAVGALSGSGMIGVAAVGTAMVMIANTLLRPVGHLLDNRRAVKGGESSAVEYTFEVKCACKDEVAVRAVVVDAVHRPGLLVRSIAATDMPEDIVMLTATVRTAKREDDNIEHALAQVIRTHAVLGVRWTAEHIESVD